MLRVHPKFNIEDSWERLRMLRALAIAAVLLNVVLVGCGDGGPVTVPISGNVQVDGKPLEQGIVSFSPADGKGSAEEAIVTAGSYSSRVTAGPKKVSIRAMKSFGKVKAYAEDPNSPMLDDIRPIKLEERASNLTFEVPASGGKFDVTDIKSVK